MCIRDSLEEGLFLLFDPFSSAKLGAGGGLFVNAGQDLVPRAEGDAICDAVVDEHAVGLGCAGSLMEGAAPDRFKACAFIGIGARVVFDGVGEVACLSGDDGFDAVGDVSLCAVGNGVPCGLLAVLISCLRPDSNATLVVTQV